jgi:hypothetical protein
VIQVFSFIYLILDEAQRQKERKKEKINEIVGLFVSSVYATTTRMPSPYPLII